MSIAGNTYEGKHTALDWQRAMTACTPGGSEFCSPEECAEYFRELRRKYGEAMKENAALKRRVAEGR